MAKNRLHQDPRFGGDECNRDLSTVTAVFSIADTEPKLPEDRAQAEENSVTAENLEAAPRSPSEVRTLSLEIHSCLPVQPQLQRSKHLSDVGSWRQRSRIFASASCVRSCTA